mmetsp:Transcript_116915/g.227347  ORF Transcript_116915/g.227347 Transcript_116915/m.227347 type:complete len:137 (+) Transcript_116915:43-453(+)
MVGAQRMLHRPQLLTICILGATLCVTVAAFGLCTHAIITPGRTRHLRTSSSNCFVGSSGSHYAGAGKYLDSTATARNFFAANGEGPVRPQQLQRQQPPAWVLALSAIAAVGFTFTLIYVVTAISAAIFGVTVIAGQ